MRIDYTISGSFSVPDGSTFLPGSRNLIRLPDGQIVSIHPVVEIASHADADDHRNVDYEEGAALGVLLEDYDRDSMPW